MSSIDLVGVLNATHVAWVKGFTAGVIWGISISLIIAGAILLVLPYLKKGK